jgi:CHAD domain-containing protein
MNLQLSNLTDVELETRLARKWALQVEALESFSAAYYDTFDWRLYLAGLSLFVEEQEQGRKLEFAEISSGEILLRVEGADEPGMLATIKDRMLRDYLAPLIEMRCLLPQVQFSGQRKVIRLLDDEEKTLVILELMAGQSMTAAREPVNLPLLLRVTGLKGYEKHKTKLLNWLNKNQVRPGDGASHLQDLLAVLGMAAGGYSSKLNFKLEAQQRADSATKHILGYLLGVIEANVEGVKADTDSEFLHDLRVAVRRTRSALGQIKNVFEPAVVARFKEDFGWIGQITGPTRDMDVYLLKFPDYVQSLPEEYRDALEPLHRYLEVHQRNDHDALATHLTGSRFQDVLQQWRAFLDEPVPNVANPANAVRPVAEVASKRIFKMYRLVMKEGKAINDDSHPEALHELRKSCKKLRYLMEFFQSIYPDAEIKLLIKSIKILLDNLGDFQDLEVQATKLKAMSEELREAKASTETLLAIGMLIDGLLQRQHQERDNFSQRFAEFSDAGNKALFSQLFKTGGGLA